MLTTTAAPIFDEGDQVVLAHGGYMGTLGVFLHLRKDPKWADITENDGSVRSIRWNGWPTQLAVPKGIGQYEYSTLIRPHRGEAD